MSKMLSDLLNEKISEDTQKQIKNNFFKESHPLNTISKIHKIIKDLGFGLEEIESETGVGSYSHALYLTLDGRRVSFSFGKGNTPEFARASAYGEMIERMQTDPNRIFRQYYALYNKKELEINEFVTCPNEKKIYNIEEYLEKDEYIKECLKYDDNRGVIKKSIETFVKSQYKTYGYVPLARFQNSLSGEYRYVNENQIRQEILGSTGFCAGNSKYEALLQGTSEILERYVKMKVIRDKLCLPIINEEDISQYTHAFKMCRNINNSNRYKVEVRDASLGGKVPVVCVILYDKVKRGYVVSFGSFPVFEIALDRTLNELLQGENIENVRTISQYKGYNLLKETYSEIKVEELSANYGEMVEFMSLVGSNKDNVANFPDNTFGNNYDYEVTKWGRDYNKSNKQMFYEVCEIIKKELNDEVLYKDYSFLGMPAYSIICLKLSRESHYGMNGHLNSMICDRGKLHDIIYGGENIDIEKLVEVYEKTFCRTNVDIILGKPLRYSNLNEQFFKACIEIAKGNYLGASLGIYKNMPELDKNFNISEENYYKTIDYWVCLYNYLSMRGKKKDAEIEYILKKFYCEKVVAHISKVNKSPEHLLDAIFKDKESPLCIIDWEKYEDSLKAFKMIHRKKVEYYKNK